MNQQLTLKLASTITFPEVFEQRRLDQTYPLSPLLVTLYCFYPSGYLIAIKDHIIEYDSQAYFKIKDPKLLRYYGPLQLFYNHKPIERYTLPQPEDQNDWTGVHSDLFKPYKHWINRDGTCGMLAATVLLSYYQDHIDSNAVHPRLRKPNSTSYEKLYGVMLDYVRSLMIKGTNAADIAFGLNRYFKDYKVDDRLSYTFNARFKMLTTFGIMKPLLTASIPKPAIIGLFSWLGAPKNYRNHWVVAYAYREDNDQIFYQVHDNHGRHAAVINARWTSSVIRLNRKTK